MEWSGRQFAAHVEPLFGDDRTIIGSIGLALDVTDRKHARWPRSGARRASTRSWDLSRRSRRDGSRRKISEFNPAAEAMFGHSRSDVVGRGLAEVLIPPRFRSMHVEGMARYLTTERAA